MKQIDDKSLATIAKLIDDRMIAEFKKRDEALRDMQQTMGRLRSQMQIQSNNWRQFSARQKAQGEFGYFL